MSVEQQKWASKLLGLNYTIEYRPGKDNRVADALSRQYGLMQETQELQKTQELQEFQLTAPLSIDLDELAVQVERDEELQVIIKALKEDKEIPTGYCISK